MGKKKILLVGFPENVTAFTSLTVNPSIDVDIVPYDSLSNLCKVEYNEGCYDIAIIYAGFKDVVQSKKTSTIIALYQSLVDSIGKASHHIICCTLEVNTALPQYNESVCQRICELSDYIRGLSDGGISVVDIHKNLSVGDRLPWYKADNKYTRHEAPQGDNSAIIGNLIRIKTTEVLWMQ